MKTNVYLYQLATKKTLYNTKLDKNVLLKVYTRAKKKKIIHLLQPFYFTAFPTRIAIAFHT